MDSIFKFNANLLDWRLRNAQTKQSDPIKETIQAAISASCTIVINGGNGIKWTGSGFHIGDGVIVTAAHVAPPDQPLDYSLSFDGQHLFPAELIVSEPDFDVALLSCKQIIKHIPPVQLADSDKAEVGDIIATIASPEGWNDTATVGRISNIHQTLGQYAPSPAWNDIIFIDADILQGSSGGMVIGTDGLVYGSVMGVTGQHADIGIGQRAICPSNKIKALISHINKTASSDKKVITAASTARLQSIDDVLAPYKKAIYSQLVKIKPELLRSAQTVYDEWQKNDDYDTDAGDYIAPSMAMMITQKIPTAQTYIFSYVAQKPHTAVLVVAKDEKSPEAHIVDIHPHIYESSGGNRLAKMRHIEFDSDMIDIEPMDYGDAMQLIEVV